MSTFRLPITGFGLRPDSTGECFLQPYDVLATNDVWKRQVCRFGVSNVAQPTIRHGFYGGFAIPKNYVGSASLIIVWTATVTSGNVVLDFEYRAVGGNDTTSLDQAGTEESLTVTDA